MIYSFETSWPDCPFPIYVVSNFLELNNKNVIFLKVGKDMAFTTNLKKALKQIDYDYIIYFQDDYFLENAVNTKEILNHINHCHDHDIDYLKLENDAMLRDEYQIENSIYCRNPINIKYSLNTAVAIWNKRKLEELCVEGFTGWDFERKIIKYIKDNKIEVKAETIHSNFILEYGIKCVEGTAVRRGKWTLSGYNYLKTHGFDSLITRRDVESQILTFALSLYNPKSISRFPVSLLIKALQYFKL
jgi:hypothetical protein